MLTGVEIFDDLMLITLYSKIDILKKIYGHNYSKRLIRKEIKMLSVH